MLAPQPLAQSTARRAAEEFPTVFNTRFGTAMVDTDDDPTLVKFMLNKPVTSMARRLVKTLKGTGFRKVQILLEDGSPVEVAAEEEAAEQAAHRADSATERTQARRSRTRRHWRRHSPPWFRVSRRSLIRRRKRRWPSRPAWSTSTSRPAT